MPRAWRRGRSEGRKAAASGRTRRRARARQAGYKLPEVLIATVILSMLLACLLPIYVGSIAEARRRACRANMRTLAEAEQAFKVRSPNHQYTTDLSELIGANAGADLHALPRCPEDPTAEDSYAARVNDDGSLTLFCACPKPAVAHRHNQVGPDPHHGYTPGRDDE